MLKRVRNLGYVTEPRVLDAADFFILQRRRRVVLMGWCSECGFEYPTFTKNKHNFHVRDILADLPPLCPGDGCEGVQDYTEPPSRYLIESGIRDKKDVLIQHLARTHNERDREIYRYAIKIWETEKRRIRYSELPEKLKTHRNQKSFEDRFKVVAGDLHACPYSGGTYFEGWTLLYSF